MISRVYRQAALDRLSSPEHLDQPVQVNPPVAWAGLAIAIALVTTAVLWAWFGSVSMEVTGPGNLQARNNEVEAVLFLRADTESKISRGTDVRIYGAQSSGRDSAPLAGKVTGVSLVVDGGMPRARVTVGLEPVSKNHAWIDAACAGHEPSSLEVTGKLLVRREHPLTLLIPALRARGGA